MHAASACAHHSIDPVNHSQAPYYGGKTGHPCDLVKLLVCFRYQETNTTSVFVAIDCTLLCDGLGCCCKGARSLLINCQPYDIQRVTSWAAGLIYYTLVPLQNSRAMPRHLIRIFLVHRFVGFCLYCGKWRGGGSASSYHRHLQKSIVRKEE